MITTLTYPAFLASALVNGDESGLSEADLKVLAAVREDMGDTFQVVDVARDDTGEAQEPRFTWSYRLYCGDAEGGDVLDYIVTT